MHIPMILKKSSAGVGYSVVDLNGARHVFASAVPRNGGDLQQQAHDALRTIEAVTHEEGTLGSICSLRGILDTRNGVERCNSRDLWLQ